MTAISISAEEHAANVERLQTPEAWPDPEPLPTVTPPAFPTEALGALRPYVEAVAEALQVPAELPGCMALAVLASGIARKARVVVRDGYAEPLNLYVLPVLESGNRNSATVEEVTGPVRAIEAELLTEAEPAIASAELRRKMREQERDGLVRDASNPKGDPTAREPARRAAEALARELASETLPVKPRLFVQDATPEKVAQTLAEQGGRLACFSAEGELFGIMAGRYSEGAANFDVFLKAHAGDTLRVDRMGGRSVTMERPALTLGLSVQPDVLQSLTRDKAMRRRGLIARFLFALPVSPLGSRKLEPAPVPATVRDAWGRLVRTVYAWPRPEQEHAITLSPDAYCVWLTLYGDVERDLGPGGRFTGWTDWGSKLPGAVARLAGLLHAAECAQQLREPWAQPIPAATMRNAVELGAYFTQHARVAFAAMYGNQADLLATSLYPWIVAQENFTARELYRAHPGVVEDSEKLAADGGPLALLAEHGIIRLQPREPGTKGRPAYRYDVNPKARRA